MSQVTAPGAPPPRNRNLKILLILDTAFSMLAIPLAIFWGMMSVMASTTTVIAGWANAYALVNLSLPVAMLVCLIAAWVAFAARRERIAWIAMFLPLLWLFVSIAMMTAWPAT